MTSEKHPNTHRNRHLPPAPATHTTDCRNRHLPPAAGNLRR
jgi:hypothetical protein